MAGHFGGLIMSTDPPWGNSFTERNVPEILLPIRAERCGRNSARRGGCNLDPIAEHLADPSIDQVGAENRTNRFAMRSPEQNASPPTPFAIGRGRLTRGTTRRRGRIVAEPGGFE